MEVPLGDFFGVGFGLRRNFVSLPLQMSPEDGAGFNCWFPMPFADGARFEVENQGDEPADLLLLRRLRGVHASWTPTWRASTPRGTGARSPPASRPRRAATREGLRAERLAAGGTGARIRRPWAEPNLDGASNYSILEGAGRGQYVGCVLNVDVFERQLNDWYGEGDDMIFIDGEPWPPRLHGTGTEDYFNTAFCPTQEYSAPYHGLTLYSGSRRGRGAARTRCTASTSRTRSASRSRSA